MVEHSISLQLDSASQVPPAKRSVSFRRDEDYAVWDERGLTIRHGNRIRSSRLEDVPTSPRLFAREEIVETIELLRAGRRKRGAAALSGAMRIGKDAYFLIRWEDRKTGPWTEALVRVRLDGAEVWPEVVGRFSGLSIAFRPVDDRLFLLAGKLATVIRKDREWGIGLYDPQSRSFDSRVLGAELLSYMPTGRKTGVFVERTSYGTALACRVDLGSGQRKPVFEGRGYARFLDVRKPMLVVATTPQTSRLHNAETGAQIEIPPGSGVARIETAVLVWSPREKPTICTLYDPAAWKILGGNKLGKD